MNEIYVLITVMLIYIGAFIITTLRDKNINLYIDSKIEEKLKSIENNAKLHGACIKVLHSEIVELEDEVSYILDTLDEFDSYDEDYEDEDDEL